MALRTFADGEGDTWRVWSVTPPPAAAATLDEEFRGGWLCFERLDGGERRRLTLSEVPAAWDVLPDDRLDLLRRVATPAGPSLLEASPGDVSVHTPFEDEARERRSGPRTVVGGEYDGFV
jgi:hypothetical protein